MAGLTGIGGKTSKTKVTLQDRLIFELLDETGGRRGEIASLRIKDIQFEKIGDTLTAILWLNGKTGVRR
jgi:integrase